MTRIYQHPLKWNAAEIQDQCFLLIPHSKSGLTLQPATPLIRASALHFNTPVAFGLDGLITLLVTHLQKHFGRKQQIRTLHDSQTGRRQRHMFIGAISNITGIFIYSSLFLLQQHELERANVCSSAIQVLWDVFTFW